jgi:hypothetical protein
MRFIDLSPQCDGKPSVNCNNLQFNEVTVRQPNKLAAQQFFIIYLNGHLTALRFLLFQKISCAFYSLKGCVGTLRMLQVKASGE